MMVGAELEDPPCDVHLLCLKILKSLSIIMKYLLLVALFFFVLWLLRKLGAARPDVQAPPASRAAERMVKCAHCGVNQPISESILTNGRYYCCLAHRHEAESQDD